MMMVRSVIVPCGSLPQIWGCFGFVAQHHGATNWTSDVKSAALPSVSQLAIHNCMCVVGQVLLFYMLPNIRVKLAVRIRNHNGLIADLRFLLSVFIGEKFGSSRIGHSQTLTVYCISCG